MELAGSIRNRRQCSPENITEQIHQALQDLDTALKSQPRLFLGPNSPYNTPKMLAMLTTTARQKFEHHLSNMNADSPSERKPKGVSETDKKVLRPTLSKLAITSLEFSEALPIAAFVALLVELVARLDLVIEEVEKLGRVACFKEFKHGGDVVVDVERRTKTEINVSSFATGE